MRIMIIGAQGSGKTTQAKLLAEKLGVCFIGTGDLLREFAKGESEDSKKVAVSLEKGELAEDKIVASVVKNKVENPECQKGFITDGFPRSIHQHRYYNPNFDKVFYLKISDEMAVKRLMGRGRADDKPELIQERLSWFHEEIKPLLEYYQGQGRLVVIDGEKPIDQVARDIENNLAGTNSHNGDSLWSQLMRKLKWAGL